MNWIVFDKHTKAMGKELKILEQLVRENTDLGCCLIMFRVEAGLMRIRNEYSAINHIRSIIQETNFAEN
uniref:Uncharacterized protein n=1 Tax=viral metagenome TaxID=1070528 RepID=A0A6H1ZM27_9ZZZZ